jgi:hypothetical protein
MQQFLNRCLNRSFMVNGYNTYQWGCYWTSHFRNIANRIRFFKRIFCSSYTKTLGDPIPSVFCITLLKIHTRHLAQPRVHPLPGNVVFLQ